MFNFKELKLDKRVDPENLDPFIGIRRSETNGFEFRLPVGFDNFPEGNFALTKQLFFRMYRSFKKFERDNLRNLQQSETTGKDNIEVGGNACQFKDKEGNDIILYSKISVIETMLEAYQDLALNVIERTLQRSERIDFSKIDRYLHKAIYLDEDVIYLEEMDLVRCVLQYKSANLIELFCFILSELQQELEQTIDERVNELANKFREQHLTYEQSLFSEETFETTVIRLKEILDEIDKTTAYKDDDYWQLYEAIEAFLYGELDMKNTHEDGIFWGINNFWQVWEDMCNTYAFKTFDDIVYADTHVVVDNKSVANQVVGGFRIFCKEGFQNPFFVEFRGEKRWIRPDLVHIHRGITLREIIKIEVEPLKMVGRADIRTELLNKSYDKAYNGLIANLGSRISKQRGNSVKGVKISKKGQFIHSIKNCPINLFTEQKELIQRKLKEGTFIIIIDWKYYSYSSCVSNNQRVCRDTIKQLSYEWSLKQNFPNCRMKSQFVIPFFYPDDHPFKDDNPIGELIEEKLLIDTLRKNGIEAFKANFFLIQRVYLSL